MDSTKRREGALLYDFGQKKINKSEKTIDCIFHSVLISCVLRICVSLSSSPPIGLANHHQSFEVAVARRIENTF